MDVGAKMVSAIPSLGSADKRGMPEILLLQCEQTSRRRRTRRRRRNGRPEVGWHNNPIHFPPSIRLYLESAYMSLAITGAQYSLLSIGSYVW